MTAPANRQRLFHASPEEFAEGAVLLPGRALGRSTFKHGDVSNTHVYLAPGMEHARTWAGLVGMEHHEDIHIYEVTPQGRTRHADEDEIRAQRAVVTKRVGTVRAPADYGTFGQRANYWRTAPLEP